MPAQRLKTFSFTSFESLGLKSAAHFWTATFLWIFWSVFVIIVIATIPVIITMVSVLIIWFIVLARDNRFSIS
jgi:hypothetical protein